MISFMTLIRCMRTGFVLAREGALGLVDPQFLPPSASVLLRIGRLMERRDAGDRGTRLRATLTRLGPTYIKMGQFLATRPDLVGFKIAQDLELLQDRVPAFAHEVAVETVEKALEKPLSELFDSFSEAVAAASIAQVHKAQLKGQTDWVAVKIVRPGIRVRFATDLKTMRFVARIIHRFGGKDARRFRAPEVVETIARSIFFEMDMRLEAAALSELAENTKSDPDFYVPEPFWDYTTGNILTTEWVDGIRMNDLEALDQAGFDRKALARIVLQSFLRHSIRDGFFHADMHPGNLFVNRSGCVVAVDFGIMGRLSYQDRRYLGEILYGFIARDYRRVAELHFKAGYVPADQSVDDFTQALRAVGEPIHNRSADEFSMARVLTLLFDITSLFEMHTQTELVLLQKTMVVVEGVSRSLDPQVNIWKISEPIVSQWLSHELGPAGALERLGQGLKTLAEVLEETPDMARRFQVLLEQYEKQTKANAFAHMSIEEPGRKKTSLFQKSRIIALWIIAFALIIRLFD